jgi:hypothetical protein
MSVATTIVAPPVIKIAYEKLLRTDGARVEDEVVRVG